MSKMDLNLNTTRGDQVTQDLIEMKAYKRRWLILVIYIVYSSINSAQWIEYSIITNIIMKYYNVSSTAVDWTAIIYMASYAPFVVPASYVIDKYGLRVAGLVGGLGTAVGTVIKLFSINQNGFWLVMIGQFCLSSAQIFIFSLAPRLAAVWFKASEISTACALGIFGSQLGCAVGFLITPIIVKNHDNLSDIGFELKILQWSYTVIIIPVAIALMFYFPVHPPKPPSVTQVQERQNQDKFSTKALIKSMKIIITNGAFMTHNIAYSINVGVFCAISTFLNQFVLHYFPDAEEDAGRMGLVMIVVGMFGCIIFGYFLDKTHRYKETLIFVYFMSAVSMVAFMFTLELKSKALTYISIGSVGLFLNSYMPVAFEMAMELSFPSPEGTTTLLLVAPSQVVGALFGILLGKLNVLVGPFWSVGFQALVLAIGTIITALIPNVLKRQAAFNQGKTEEEIALNKN